MEEKYIAVGNTGCNCIIFGHGTKPLVLIPGLSLRDMKGMGMGIAYMYRCFGENFKVYCIDKPDTIATGTAIKDIARIYAQVFAYLDIKSACILGISMGGMIAQYLALEHPELVERLVLGVSAARQNETSAACLNTWIKLARQADAEALVLDSFRKVYSERYLRRCERYMGAIMRMNKRIDLDRFALLAEACLDFDVYVRLGEIQCPMLVIGGRLDKVLTVDSSEEIAEKTGCEIYVYEELGHSVYEEAKDFNKRVLEFFIKSF